MPAFVDGEVQKLLDAVETSTHIGLRERALLGVLAYTFARIGAVVNLKVEDYSRASQVGRTSGPVP
jgi:site-specific recombinase XerD